MELNEKHIDSLANALYHANSDTVYFPVDTDFDDDYWYEDYDFNHPAENSIGVDILQKKTVSIVHDESFDGDQTYFLIEIEGEKYIFCDGYSSWGDSSPTLVKAEKTEAYISGDVYFVE
jgi:hypothetical protein